MELVCSVANVTNKEIAATMKSHYDRARQAMEMKPLLESKRQWEFAFGDVGDTQDNDEDNDDCSKYNFQMARSLENKAYKLLQKIRKNSSTI